MIKIALDTFTTSEVLAIIRRTRRNRIPVCLQFGCPPYMDGETYEQAKSKKGWKKYEGSKALEQWCADTIAEFKSENEYSFEDCFLLFRDRHSTLAELII